MENQTFTYSYSAAQTREAEAIRKKYAPREEDKLERLRHLDGKVQRAGLVEGLCLGIVGVLTFGIAMCFGLHVFGSAVWPAIPLGLLGTVLMAPAYFVHKRLYDRKKEELTPEILALSEELIKD